MRIQTALQQAASLLEEAGIIAPRLTAEVLLCHVLGRERSYLYGHPEETLSETAWLHYGRHLHQRLQGKPTQYITGRQEFFGRPFLVTPAVLIPRPETEHVVETALRVGRGARRILDVGCGSGALAVTLSVESRAEVVATDISTAALHVAAENARRLGAGVQFIACDLASALAPGSVDLLVSNPPYVPQGAADGLQREIREWEPPIAVFAGPTGLEIYQGLIREAARVLRPGGVVVFELGFKCLDGVRIMLEGGWRDIVVEDDLAGIPRVITARIAA